MDAPTADRAFEHVTVLGGVRGGKYPYGHSLLVRGSEEQIVIDPSLSLLARATPPPADRILNSHCHEDHVAGNHLYPAAPCHLHERDVAGIRSLDDFMAIYGFTAEIDTAFRRTLLEQFHFVPRPDAHAFRDGDVFDLGRCHVRAIHAPGHTSGHTIFHIEPDDVVYLGDIDLSSFGPYYGDASSSLLEFEATLAMVREIKARAYATFHHIGVLDDREAFLTRLDRFTQVIAARDGRLLAFLAAPRTLAEIIAHRFIYRPGDTLDFIDDVERRSMIQHLSRLAAAGRVDEVEPKRFMARAA